MTNAKWQFRVKSSRIDSHESRAKCKQAEISLDTNLAGNPDAYNPAEQLLAALSACMIKGFERVAPSLKFSLRGGEVDIRRRPAGGPPRMKSIHYEAIVDTDETDHRLELLYENVKK